MYQNSIKDFTERVHVGFRAPESQAYDDFIKCMKTLQGHLLDFMADWSKVTGEDPWSFESSCVLGSAGRVGKVSIMHRGIKSGRGVLEFMLYPSAPDMYSVCMPDGYSIVPIVNDYAHTDTDVLSRALGFWMEHHMKQGDLFRFKAAEAS